MCFMPKMPEMKDPKLPKQPLQDTQPVGLKVGREEDAGFARAKANRSRGKLRITKNTGVQVAGASNAANPGGM